MLKILPAANISVAELGKRCSFGHTYGEMFFCLMCKVLFRLPKRDNLMLVKRYALLVSEQQI